MDLLRSSVNLVKHYAGPVAWNPLVHLSRDAILAVFRRIEVGQLEITDCDGQITTCGAGQVEPGVTATAIVIHKETFWVRMLLFADMVGSQHPGSFLLDAISILTCSISRALQRVICLASFLAAT